MDRPNMTVFGRATMPPGDDGTRLAVCKGRVDPQDDVLLSAGAGVYDAAIPIPAGVVAARVFLDAPAHITVDNTEGDPAKLGSPSTPDHQFDLPCVGCTFLHGAQAGAGNATLSLSWVY